MLWLTGTIPAKREQIEALAAANVGFIGTPNMGYKAARVREFPYWAADTGLFSPAGERSFNLERYLRWLDARPSDTCLFATAPDKVGDGEETLRRSLPVLPLLREAGLPAAYVAQDGMGEPPWDELDCLFIGGTDGFKFSSLVASLVGEARERKKWVHFGRINSFRRFARAREMGGDSADGTYLAFGPDVLLPKLLGWLGGYEQLTLGGANAHT